MFPTTAHPIPFPLSPSICRLGFHASCFLADFWPDFFRLKNTTKVMISRIEKIKLKDVFNVKSEVVSAFAYFHTILCVNFCSKLEKKGSYVESSDTQKAF